MPVEGLLGQALGLVHPAMVRRWLASGKGFMRKIHPAVVRLTCAHAEACFIRKWDARHVRIGTDPGSETTGIAVIVDSKVVWCAEITHRSSAIRKALVTRSGARSGRRYRRTTLPKDDAAEGRSVRKKECRTDVRGKKLAGSTGAVLQDGCRQASTIGSKAPVADRR